MRNKSEAWRRWRERNPEKAKASALVSGRKYYHNTRKPRRLMELYGLTTESWNALFASQGSKCAVCGNSEHDGRGWVVDHCHETEVVRGILCHKCNVGLGHLQDDPDLLNKAVMYLNTARHSDYANDNTRR